MSDALTKSFWKYASTVKGTSTIEDTFETWASKQASTLDELNDTWLSVQVDIQTAFNKTAANVEINGDPLDIKEMFAAGNTGTAPIKVPKVEGPLGAIKQGPGAPPIGGPKPPSGPLGGMPGAGAPPMGAGGPPPAAGAPAEEPDLMSTLAETE